MACGRCGSKVSALQNRLARTATTPPSKVPTGRVVNTTATRPGLLNREAEKEAKKDA